MDSKDRPYSWHVAAVRKAQAAYDAASITLCDIAIASGHGHTMPTVLRTLPRFRDLYATKDAALAVLESAESAAVAAKCAYYYKDGFNWYSSHDAARWRRKAA